MVEKWSVSKRQAQRKRQVGERDVHETATDERPVPQGTVRETGRTPAGTFGAAVVLIAVAVLVLNFTLPWAVIQYDEGVTGPDGSQSETLMRGDLSGESDYGDRLVGWPFAAFIVAIIAGTGLFGIDHLGGLYQSTHRGLQGLLLAGIAFFGFLLTLTGTRWLGLQTAGMMREDGLSALVLHVVPYLNLIVGCALLLGALRHLRDPLEQMFAHDSDGLIADPGMRTTGLMVAVAASSLLLISLLPLSLFNNQGLYFTEGALIDVADRGGDLFNGADRAFTWVRAMTWVVLYVFLAGLLVATAHRALGGGKATRALMWLPVVAIVPLVLMVVFTVLFYTRHASATNVDLFLNPFFPLSVLAMILAYVYWVIRGFMPMTRPPKESAVETSTPEPP